MPAPKTPNTSAATEASVAARRRTADEKLATQLRSRGWTCHGPKLAEGERRWNYAVDWLLNSRHTADPDIQNAFWGYIDGKLTEDQLQDS